MLDLDLSLTFLVFSLHATCEQISAIAGFGIAFGNVKSARHCRIFSYIRRPGSTSSVRSTGSRSIRKMPLDEESSRLVADKTGAVRGLAPPVKQVLPHPSGSKLEDDSDGWVVFYIGRRPGLEVACYGTREVMP